SSHSSADSHSEASSSPKPSKEKSPKRSPEKIKPRSEKSKGSQEKPSSSSSSSITARNNPISIQRQNAGPKKGPVSDEEPLKTREPTPSSPSCSSASHHSDSDLNIENLILELRKATSATVVESNR
ncbi:hypothetical protein PIB30_093020, partial [Stylosanthes scabra]|nr:hypothetical protein [Stylosanthes scabra]